MPQETKANTTNKIVSFYQHRFLNLFLGLALGLVSLQGGLQFIAGDPAGLIFSVVAAVALFVSWLALRKNHYQLASSLAILVVLSTLLYVILSSGLGDATIFWFFIFPVLAFFLKGKVGGTIWLLLLVLVVLSLFVASHLGMVTTIDVAYDAVTFRQLIASLFLVSIFVYVYQDHMDEKEAIIQQRERELADINTQLIQEVAEHKETAKSLERTLRDIEREQAKDEALLQSIGEGIFAINKQGKIIAFNPAVRNFFNVSEKDAKQKPWHKLFKLVDSQGRAVPLDKRPLQRTLENGQKYNVDDYYYIDRNGNQVPVAITATPVVLDKKVFGAVEVVRDISQERAIERAKDEFVSLASHQLRTPLSSINWYAQALTGKKKLPPARAAQYLQAIRSSAERMTELVGDFLDVSRFELGTMKLRVEAVDVVDLVTKSLQELKPAIQDKQLQVESKISPKLPKVSSDSHLLGIIVQNLLSNAVKYTPKQGSITVTLKDYTDEQDHGDRLLFSVEDSGIGIPPEDQKQIFSKLFRSDNALEGEITGTGLGLYIVKSAVEALGGEIWFESQVDKGSVFAVMLPVKTPEQVTKKKGGKDAKTKTAHS